MKKLLSILALLFCSLASAQVVLVNHAASATGTTSAINCTGSNFIAIWNVTGPGYPSSVRPIDSSGNVYSLGFAQPGNGYSPVSIWYVFAPTVTSSMTFTSPGSSPTVPIAAMCFSGVASGPDQSAGNFCTGSNCPTGTITPTNAYELVLGGVSVQTGSAPTSVTGLTFVDGVYAAPFGLADGYQIQGSSASSAEGTFNTGVNAAIVSFYSTAAPATLAVTTTNLPEGFISTAYSGSSSIYSPQLTAAGGDQPYTWSCPSTCALPSGLSLSSSGLITGTPTTAGGPTNVTFEVTDSASPTPHTATATIPITIAATAFSGTAGTCTGTGLNGTQHTAFGGCALSATGGTSPYSFTISNNANYGQLPPGLVVSGSGAISSPSIIGGQGEYEPQITIQDNLGSLFSFTLLFQIQGNNVTSLLPWSGSIFNARVDSLPVDTSPAAPVQSAIMGYHLNPGFGAAPANGGNPNGIPFFVVPYNQGSVSVTTSLYQNYFGSGPWPWYAPIEDSWNCPDYSCDHHASVLQYAGGGNPAQLQEMWEGDFAGTPGTNGPWTDYSNFYLLNIGTSGVSIPLTGTFTNGSAVITGISSVPVALVNYANFCQNATTDCNSLTTNPLTGSLVPSNATVTTATSTSITMSQTYTGTTTSGSSFDVVFPAYAMPPQGNGSSDAAGLPFTFELYTADEVIGTGTPSAPNGVIQHPGRFTIPNPLKYYVWPALNASFGIGQGSCSGGYEDSNFMLKQADPPTSCGISMPLGENYRLKASVLAALPSCFATSPQATIIATGMAHYGMVLADHGGTFIGVSGVPDPRWNDTDLGCLAQLPFSDFEPVNVSGIAVNLPSTPSAIGSYQTTSTPQSATPTFSPAAGAVTNPTTVTASTSTSGCGSYIYFDTNPTPTTNTTTYNVTTAVTLYAYVHGCPGYTDSSVGSAAYTITGAPPPGVAPQLLY